MEKGLEPIGWEHAGRKITKSGVSIIRREVCPRRVGSGCPHTFDSKQWLWVCGERMIALTQVAHPPVEAMELPGIMTSSPGRAAKPLVSKLFIFTRNSSSVAEGILALFNFIQITLPKKQLRWIIMNLRSTQFSIIMGFFLFPGSLLLIPFIIFDISPHWFPFQVAGSVLQSKLRS